MEKIAVIGLGLFGKSVAMSLVQEGAEVVAIDSDMLKVEEIKEEVTYAVRVDAGDEKGLKSIGIKDMDVVIVAIEKDFEACQLAVIYSKKAGVKKVIARAMSDLHSRILKLIGADEIVNPEYEYGRRLGSRLVRPQLIDYAELGEGFSFAELKVPKEFVGKTPIDIELRKNYNVNLICIRRDTVDKVGKQTRAVISDPKEAFMENDILFLVGTNKNLEKLSEI